MNIHSKIKEFRQKKNFSQADMAEKLNIALLNYGKIERGVTELSVKRLYEIAKILEVSVTELLGEPMQINDSEKITGLEKRVSELEKWLTDKEFLLNHFKHRLTVENEGFQKIMASILYDIILFTAHKNKIGKCVVGGGFNGNEEYLLSQNIGVLNISEFKLKNILDYGFEFELIEPKDQELLFNEIIKNPLFDNIVKLCFNDINDDNIWLLSHYGRFDHLILLLYNYVKSKNDIIKNKKSIKK